MSFLENLISEERAKIIEELEAKIWARLEPRIDEALFSRVMTVEAAAIYLDVSQQTVRRMIRDGELPAFRVRGQWRIRLHELDAWVEDQIERR